MISFIGNYSYDFPRHIPLKKKLKDYLDDNVDEKYYINNEKSDKLIKQLIDNDTLQQHNLERQTCMEEFQNDVKIIGQMDNTIDHTFESANRVYDTDGVAPTMNTCGGGGLQPKILEEQIPFENVRIRQATNGGSTECEIGGCFDASYPKSKTRRGRVQDKGNTCPTLTAQNQEVVRIEKVCQISSNGSQCGTVISDNGISTNLVAGTHGYANSHIATQYRIRKLTPRECGRLMGVSDEDIDKMETVNSNSQIYKQFGNSIVVDVLCAIFKQMNIEQENEK